MPIYQPFAVSFYSDAMGSAEILPDITRMDPKLNPEIAAELVAQTHVPRHVAVRAIKPNVAMETYALATALDRLGVQGLGFEGATNPGVTAYFKKFTDVGDLAAGSVHRSLTYHTGVAVPKRLTVDHQGDAKLEFEIVPIKTSSNAVVIVADNVALPAVTIASARWTLGAVKINNVALSEYSKLEIDFGNTVEVVGSQSDPYATHIEHRKHEPKIKLSGIDPTWFAASPVPLGGAAVLSANDYVYLRKRTQDGAHFVANGTAEHIKFSLAGLAGIMGNSGEAQRVSETELLVTLAQDASGNNPLIVNTAATHPA